MNREQTAFATIRLLLARSVQFLTQRSRLWTVCVSFLLLAAIGAVDYRTGFERSWLVFYLLPVALGTWFVSWAFGLILCALSVSVWMVGDIAAGAVYSSPSIPIWNAGIALAFFLIVAALLSKLRTLLHELEERVRQRTAALRSEIEKRKRLEKDVTEVTERERQHIGHELHDTVCQHLTATSLSLQVLRGKLAGASLPETKDADRGVQLVEDAIELTRKIAQGLFPLELEGTGLRGALIELCRTTASRYRIRCEFRGKDLQGLIFDSNVATHLYRIAQEAVTNALKHGHVSRVTVDMSQHDRNVILNVIDDGIGFPEPLPESRGLGLRIMSSRAGMIGGNVSVTNRSGGGVTVTCCVPVPSNESKNRGDFEHVSLQEP